MSRSPVPPRFVPTLPEIVQPVPLQTPAMADPATPMAASAEVMMRRIMQRVDLVLEKRLREASGQLMLEQNGVAQG